MVWSEQDMQQLVRAETQDEVEGESRVVGTEWLRHRKSAGHQFLESVGPLATTLFTALAKERPNEGKVFAGCQAQRRRKASEMR